MSEKNRAFDQVKAILEKLDRSIDEARQKRLHGDEPEADESQPRRESENSPRAQQNEPAQPERPAEVPSGQAARRAGSSPYGRAKPLRPNGNGDTAAWRSTSEERA
ncbi:MAG: hypothetical protein EA423_02750 [Phycisphaerales bacterium]|nr:MAG: hypothetical protein EA423_02750 [Phycisphaerales bacterium]